MATGVRAVYYLLLYRLRLSRVDAVSMRLYDAGDARVEDLESSVPSVFIPAHRSAIQFRRSHALRLEPTPPCWSAVAPQHHNG